MIKVQKTTQVNMQAEIAGASVNINYSFGSEAPQNVNVNANFSTEGGNSSRGRNYKPDGTYTPVAKVMIYPFDETFDAALKAIVDQVAIKFAIPQDIEG